MLFVFRLAGIQCFVRANLVHQTHAVIKLLSVDWLGGWHAGFIALSVLLLSRRSCRADRILTKAASLHTRPDALGKALRETLRDVRGKLSGRGGAAAHMAAMTGGEDGGHAAAERSARASSEATAGAEAEEWEEGGTEPEGDAEYVASPTAS